MKCIVARNDLCSLVNRAYNIASQRTPMPILAYLYLEARDDKIIVTAMDLTVGVRFAIPAKVIDSGATTIPARRLAQLLKEVTGSFVEIASTASSNHIQCGSSTFKLPSLPAADYPPFPSIEGAEKVVFSQKDLVEALSCTVFAVAKEETRYLLTGLLLSISGETALICGANGLSLARVTVPVTVEKPLVYECVIPARAVDEIIKNLSGSDEQGVLYVMNDKIAVHRGDDCIAVNLLVGEFPDVERVIPTQLSMVVPLQREELESLLKQTALFVTDKTAAVRFSFQENLLSLSIDSTEGEGRVSMEIAYSGAPLEMAFHPVSFLDALRHCRGDQVYLGIQDPFNPVVVSDVAFDMSMTPVPSPLFILMPLRVT